MANNSLDNSLNAPHHQIRAVLRALCQDVDTRSRALSYLEDLQAIDEPSNSRKRKADDDLCICVQCDDAFYKSDNTDNTACYYHWGELEVDYEAYVWADHDERCHGTIDTEAMRKENPEGFTWVCCGKPGDESGCKLGKHEADPDKSRRETGDEPSDSDTDEFDEEDNEDEDE
ncbi:hypothetical protein FAVG1_09003 [Fusarium avenaceum]|nr:hypothetical protein FAVG1_09003 [Fusarium avenaceum]